MLSMTVGKLYDDLRCQDDTGSHQKLCKSSLLQSKPAAVLSLLFNQLLSFFYDTYMPRSPHICFQFPVSSFSTPHPISSWKYKAWVVLMCRLGPVSVLVAGAIFFHCLTSLILEPSTCPTTWNLVAFGMLTCLWAGALSHTAWHWSLDWLTQTNLHTHTHTYTHKWRHRSLEMESCFLMKPHWNWWREVMMFNYAECVALATCSHWNWFSHSLTSTQHISGPYFRSYSYG